jgi:hypothetical protein
MMTVSLAAKVMSSFVTAVINALVTEVKDNNDVS